MTLRYLPDDSDLNPGEVIYPIFCCSKNSEDPWWVTETLFESDLDKVQEEVQKLHNTECGCGEEIQVLV